MPYGVFRRPSNPLKKVSENMNVKVFSLMKSLQFPRKEPLEHDDHDETNGNNTENDFGSSTANHMRVDKTDCDESQMKPCCECPMHKRCLPLE